MRPFRYMSNEKFEKLVNKICKIYDVKSLKVLLVKIFEKGDKFKDYTDWFLFCKNINYGYKGFDRAVSVVFDYKAYGVMKLYHKNYDTRSIAFIFRNVLTYVFKYILCEGVEKWNVHRDISIDDFKRNRKKFKKMKTREIKKREKESRKKAIKCSFSININYKKSKMLERMSLYDENVDFVEQYFK